MKNNNLFIFLGIGGVLVGYYFWNKNRQKQLATQQVQPIAELDEEDEEREIAPVGGGGGGGGFMATPSATTPTPTVVVATNTSPAPASVSVSQPLTQPNVGNLLAPSSPAPAPSSPAPAPVSQLAPSPSLPPKSPLNVSPISPLSQIQMPKINLAKSPFSGMDGRNSYDIDVNLDM